MTSLPDNDQINIIKELINNPKIDTIVIKSKNSELYIDGDYKYQFGSSMFFVETNNLMIALENKKIIDIYTIEELIIIQCSYI